MRSCALLIASLLTLAATAQTKQRARALGVPFDGTTGPLNAITDVPGILVGYKTIIKGKADSLIRGKGPVRTGVTVILPKGKSLEGYPAGWFSLNGDGEMTGIPYIDDYGRGYGAIGITNTNSVGTVRDAIGQWNTKEFSSGNSLDFAFSMPIVAETFDGMLNDINGFHVKTQDVWDALDSAHGGAIAEGNVGGGTGMSLFGFKGGSGTASRVIRIDSTSYTVGVFVQANFGGRKFLNVAGVPVGKEITDLRPVVNMKEKKDGSIIVVIATDAPLMPLQLKQVAKRAVIGIARTGGWASNGSGDIFVALSTHQPGLKGSLEQWSTVHKEMMDPIYLATAEATEEAIINVLLAAETMQGINGNTWHALPHDRLVQVLKQYNRFNKR
ncbi:P1 family peptidase [Paraflavitalea pollutisoli]|uniref:DmpA family aminopeptidase n=1 Tax=Paraflavitalea pollutisoli TaxID=3034143 RepID=UPI0023EC8B84|nr:P1 family peptidase [Paraflavitalea sp. H1-2-19X]